jgi:hypothetical protein
MEEARLIALKLQSLDKSDREWIFSRLDGDTQSKLLPLLDELNELGFELDSRVVNAIPQARRAMGDSITTEDQSNIGAITVIDKASFSQLALVFEQEPPVIFRCLVALRRWQWMGQFKSEAPSALVDMVPQSGFASMPVLKSTAQSAFLSVIARQLDAVARIGKFQQADISERQKLGDSKRSVRFHLRRFAPWLP